MQDLNTVQAFGLLMLGGLISGECCRRLVNLPRTTGYVLFGLISGQSGYGWIDAKILASAEFFIDLALGLIVFELGQRLHTETLPEIPGWQILKVGLIESVSSFLALSLLLHSLAIPWALALFAAAVAVSTSPAITIATSSDVGARGPRSQLLYHCVAINGGVAFTLLILLMPFLAGETPTLAETSHALLMLVAALLLALTGAALILYGARLLGKHPEHQHMLLLSLILLGVGTAMALGISVLLSLLLMGYLTHRFDRSKQVVGIRIGSDARVFLVVTFVLAGASLDVQVFLRYWEIALLIALVRFASKLLPICLLRRQLGLGVRESLLLAVGLLPMSSVALVLIADGSALANPAANLATGSLLATILCMQLVGPLATQTAIRGFGEASALRPLQGYFRQLFVTKKQ
jgi:Kef-type K+ transport system membrane component KefB